MKMRILAIALLFIVLVAIWAMIFSKYLPQSALPIKQSTISSRAWEMKSIDTMKYSRDRALTQLNNPSFDSVIEAQVKTIAETGATHIAIATPYDKQFLPFLKRWVQMARKYKLKVWFRGNFSGWEGWFNYPKILTRAEHLRMTREFISDNPSLFEDNDAFTACPECENGGPGDPRSTGDKEGHKQFLIDEHNAAGEEFRAIGKTVATTYNSMNFDVAKIIMDKPTTIALGGIVAIDHYVDTPSKLVRTIKEIAQSSGGKIFLGEFGVPLPHINGAMNEIQQAAWIEEALHKLSMEPSVMGVSYWINAGGPTALWNEDGTPKKAANILQSYFIPRIVSGVITDQYENPISQVTISSVNSSTFSNTKGEFSLSILPFEKNVSIQANGQSKSNFSLPESGEKLRIIVQRSPQNFIDFLRDLIYKNL